MANEHDVYRIIFSQNITAGSSGGAATSTASMNAQTYAVQICSPGSTSSTGGVRIAIGKAPVAVASDAFLPSNWVQVYRIMPGEKVSAISNDAGIPTVNVVEVGN